RYHSDRRRCTGAERHDRYRAEAPGWCCAGRAHASHAGRYKRCADLRKRMRRESAETLVIGSACVGPDEAVYCPTMRDADSDLISESAPEAGDAVRLDQEAAVGLAALGGQ